MAKWDYLQKATPKEVVEGVMNDKPGKVSAEIKPDPKRIVEEVCIRKVDNGFTATIRYRDKKEKNKDGETRAVYEEPSTKIYKNASDAGALLEECFQ